MKLGDKGSLDRVRELMVEFPELRDHYGNLARKAEQDWIEAVGGDDTLTEEGIRFKLMDLRASLVGDDPTPEEEMLVDYVGVCWLAAYQTERASAKATAKGDPRHMASASHAAESAQRRYLSAAKTLPELRRKVKRKSN